MTDPDGPRTASDKPASGPIVAARFSPVSAALFDRLAGGGWTHVDDVVAAGAAAVAPGFSIRRQGGPTGDDVRDQRRRVAGARAVAMNNLERLRRHNRIQRSGDQVRMEPSCLVLWERHRAQT